MQPGGDFAEVFKRLAIGYAEIDKYLMFLEMPQLGNISSCPTNLGTGLKASALVHLPVLGDHIEHMQQISKDYNVQFKALYGGHSQTNSAGHIFVVSNKIRMERTEVNLMQDLNAGLLAMLIRESTI